MSKNRLLLLLLFFKENSKTNKDSIMTI